MISKNYLSLAKHPKIKQAFKQGIDKFSSGAGVHRT
jgi:7-keto-8-aminopelargonate synthetase-like enzyme